MSAAPFAEMTLPDVAQPDEDPSDETAGGAMPATVTATRQGTLDGRASTAGPFPQTVTAPSPERRDDRVPARTALDALQPGESVDDFDLVMGLGRGAFARVFLARQRSMQRLVALKVSLDHGTEPQTLAQLDHDYIVRVFDQTVLPDRGLRLLYMQYLPGGTLLDLLARVRRTPPAERDGRLLLAEVDDVLAGRGEIRPIDSSVRAHIEKLSWPETIAWLGRRLASALDYAGGRGVLHRDIKPANVLLTAEGVPKLVDFNISFCEDVAGANPLAYFGGSLSYMSPEQLAGCDPDLPGSALDLDGRSDIYSLAVMLWELLTGYHPFADAPAGEPPVEAGQAERGAGGVREATPARLYAARLRGVGARQQAHLPADCPTSLRRVLLRALSPDTGDRWSSGRELAQQFDLCLDAHARNLVDPPPDSWRSRLSHVSLPVLALGIGIPNLLAALYNYAHNRSLIIAGLPPASQHRFVEIAAGVNIVMFPLGAAILFAFGWLLLTVPHRIRHGRVYPAATLARARADTLLFADRVVLVCLALWGVSGLSFPIALALSGGTIGPHIYVHFIWSQLVCGAMAVAYPFFAVALYTIRCVYPAFLPYGEADENDARRLRRLGRHSTVYLAVAASTPLIAVVGVTLMDASDLSEVIGPVRILCVGSVLAFALVYWMFRLLEDDLRALARVIRAPRPVPRRHRVPLPGQTREPL